MVNKALRYLDIFTNTCLLVLVVLPLVVSAAPLRLEWMGNNPSASSFRLFQRNAGEPYNYSNWIYSGPDTSFTVDNLQEGLTYYFVVRAYSAGAESVDSMEIKYTADATEPEPEPVPEPEPEPVPEPEPDPTVDSDGDGVADILDAFPYDPGEWFDTDADGIGNNADTDDDNDGMPDTWEIEYGLDPLVNDASEDLDGDGISNADEYANNGNPAQAPGNQSPFGPELSDPADAAIVSLTPSLTTQDYLDPDGDAHARTRFQIATDIGFAQLVLDRTIKNQLTRLDVMELVLDPDTTYYWRACFIDARSAASPWSELRSFTTVDSATAGDGDGNGILDTQEADSNVDLDNDGTPDTIQDNVMCVRTSDTFNPHVAIKQSNGDVQLAGVRALTLNGLGLYASQPKHMTGLISFKLFLVPDLTTVSITVLFSEPAPVDAEWYKFSTDEGWQAYPNVSFSEDRKSMTILLEDGGAGDQDGVQNGIIVDPSGLGFEQMYAPGSGSTFSDQTACFVSTPLSNIEAQKSHSLILMLLVAIGGAVCGVIERRSKYKR